MLVQIQPNKSGQFFQTDFGDNTGGTNLADSVFKITDNQASGGYNFDYILTGGIRKRLGPQTINSSPDSQVRTLGFGLYAPASGLIKALMRAAGTKLQLFDTGAPLFTPLMDDTAGAGSNPFVLGSTQTVNFSQFNNGVSNILWMAGGGATLPIGAYSQTNYTTNGASPAAGTLIATDASSPVVLKDLTFTKNTPPAGSTILIKLIGGAVAGSEVVTVSGTTITIKIQDGSSTANQINTAYGLVSAATSLVTCSVSGTGSNSQNIGRVAISSAGTWPSTSTYAYTIVYRKLSTQGLSNASLDVTATLLKTTDTVYLDLSGLTGLDTTLVDEIFIFRSAAAGAVNFTTGSLIAQIPSTQTSYVDTGPTTDLASAQNIPRNGNLLLDNSVLPAGTYNALTMFKRRLVTSQNSTLYLSDLNKSESWPASNVITVPSAGNITGLAVISFTSPQAQTLDEILVIFKEREDVGTDRYLLF